MEGIMLFVSKDGFHQMMWLDKLSILDFLHLNKKHHLSGMLVPVWIARVIQVFARLNGKPWTVADMRDIALFAGPEEF